MYYELAMLLNLAQSDKERAEVRATAEGFVTKHKGKIERTEEPVDFDLAYPIKKQYRGQFALSYFSLPAPSHLKEIERELRLNTDLLRFMIVKLDEIPEAPKDGEPSFKLPTKKDRVAPKVTRRNGSKSRPTAPKPKIKPAEAKIDESLKKKKDEEVKLEDVGEKLDDLLEIKEVAENTDTDTTKK